MHKSKTKFRLLLDKSGNTRVFLSVIVLIFAVALIFLVRFLIYSDGEVVDFSDVATSAQVTGDSTPVLRIAVAAMISPKNTKKYYEELLQLIAAKVGRRVEFSQRKTYAEVNEMLERQEVDLAFVCSGPYVAGHEKFNMEILAVPVVQGQTVYYSYIIANKSSLIESFADLKGKKFAFTDPHSNTGSTVPRYMLSRMDQTPESYFAEFFYSYSHDNSIKAVADGLADGAAVDHLIWEFMNIVDPEHTSKTKIIGKSDPYGIPPVVVHPALATELKSKLRDTFFSIHMDEEASVLLGKLHIDRFESGADEMYDSVREMGEWLKQFKDIE